jgi:hypothetical protein
MEARLKIIFTIRGFNTHESLSNYTTFKPIYSGATVPLKEDLFLILFFFYVCYSTLLHLPPPPPRFHSVGGCCDCDRSQDCYDFGIDSQTL